MGRLMSREDAADFLPSHLKKLPIPVRDLHLQGYSSWLSLILLRLTNVFASTPTGEDNKGQLRGSNCFGNFSIFFHGKHTGIHYTIYFNSPDSQNGKPVRPWENVMEGCINPTKPGKYLGGALNMRSCIPGEWIGEFIDPLPATRSALREHMQFHEA
ncbi:hypothetical protein FHS85_005169 [Rhodoligotrophos appendicifer]|uniref:hypothetical protein n=1 Tax=Rhodoligotrophos appendicifer TaxID=987056 RepID=UPI0011846E5A|nr:hypothetical protein [Rhodoligotrophos appendicifer]